VPGIRFYTDEHVGHAVAAALGRRGVDAVTVVEAGMRTAEDLEHLAWARAEGRVLVTLDADFLRLHATGEEHAGIVYGPQGTPLRRIISGLMLIHDVLTPEEMAGHVEFL
jgi:hypothetical protein